MYYLFEDDEETPSSKLIKTSATGYLYRFSGSSNCIIDELGKMVKGNVGNILVFLDMNPNNECTVNFYHYLVNEVLIKFPKNVIYVLPIICIEYYISKMCLKYGYFNHEQLQKLAVKYLTDRFDWNYIPIEFRKISLEKLYKRIFGYKTCRQECMINVKKLGKFYKNDCTCCSLSDSSASHKGNQLISMLPLFTAFPNNFISLGDTDMKFEYTTIENVFEEQQQFYDMLCDVMHKERIKLEF